MQNTHIHQAKISRAWNGDSILALPVDRLFLNRGVFATYDAAKFSAPPRFQQPGQQRPPQDKQDPSKDTSVVLEALQRILRKKEDKPNLPFGEFGQARPVR